MAWLTTYNATNRIDLESREDTEKLNIVLGTVSSWERTITQAKYEYVGMTEASAKTGQAAIHDPANGIWAVAKRQNTAGAWKIDVTTRTASSWTQV